MSNDKIIQIKSTVKCLNCHGHGKHNVTVDLSLLMRMAEMTYATTNKIEYIKQIRKEWSLPLEPAKELAEAALLLIATAKNTLYAYVPDS